MKLIFPILFLLNLIFSSDQIPAPDQDHPMLIKGGTIHTVSHGTLENADILFDNGKIISVGHELTIPAETEMIDAAGKHVFQGSFQPDLLLACKTLVRYVPPGIMQK